MNSIVAIILNIISALLLSRTTVFPPAQAFFGDFLCRRPGLPVSASSIISAKSQPVPPANIEAASAAVLAIKPNMYILEKDDKEPRSIASITKLMTALVFLDHNPGWDKEYTIAQDDIVLGGVNHLFPGDTVTVKQLFYASLVASDNVATQALSSATGMSQSEFVSAMNKKAASLGLLSTSFVDPVGLGDGNLSTASDIARMARQAFSSDDIRQAVLEPRFSFTTKQGKTREVESTDFFTRNIADGRILLGGKTGYTEAAGYCFVGQFDDGAGHQVISVIMGTDSKQSRFDETEKAVSWSFDNFTW